MAKTQNKFDQTIVSIIFCIAFLALSYYALTVLPNRITRRKLVITLILLFVVLIVVPNLVEPSHGVTDYPLLNSALISLQIIFLLSIGNQMSYAMVDAQKKYHIKHNSSNLDRTPIRQLMKYHEQIKKAFTWGWFASSIVVLGGIWINTK